MVKTSSFEMLGASIKIYWNYEVGSQNTIGGRAKELHKANLDRGLLDFAIIVEPVDFDKYNYLKLPVKDTLGILMQKESPLAKKK